MRSLSALQKARLDFQPKFPSALKSIHTTKLVPEAQFLELNPQVLHLFPHVAHLYSLKIEADSFMEAKPLRLGVVFSGGQAPGGHNVIGGLFDALKQLNPESKLFGFLNGPMGVIKNQFMEISDTLLAFYRNQGGFDLLGSGRDKIESEDHLKAVHDVVQDLKLDGLVIIGGDDSNTNAAVLAEYFAANGSLCTVVGVPKTIDGDLKNASIEISFGFDTACKTYAAIIGDIMRDTLSAKKSYYFIKLMGRSASHIALECALQTHPNLTLISEEIFYKKSKLLDLVKEMSDIVCARSIEGKEYGVFLIPEGVIEFIPEVKTLINELNHLLAGGKHSIGSEDASQDNILKHLTEESNHCFVSLPKSIQEQLLLSRDPHGNVQVSKIETERLLIEMVTDELNARRKAGIYSGKFSAQPHFCGYEGRSSLPSNFDSQYCYALGRTAAALVKGKANGYMSCIQNLVAPVEEWKPFGIPLVSMMTIEQRHGVAKPVIKKALIDLKDTPFKVFEQQRQSWSVADDYISPGPIQFFGPAELKDSVTQTLLLESKS